MKTASFSRCSREVRPIWPGLVGILGILFLSGCTSGNPVRQPIVVSGPMPSMRAKVDRWVDELEAKLGPDLVTLNAPRFVRALDGFSALIQTLREDLLGGKQSPQTKDESMVAYVVLGQLLKKVEFAQQDAAPRFALRAAMREVQGKIIADTQLLSYLREVLIDLRKTISEIPE